MNHGYGILHILMRWFGVEDQAFQYGLREFVKGLRGFRERGLSWVLCVSSLPEVSSIVPSGPLEP